MRMNPDVNISQVISRSVRRPLLEIKDLEREFPAGEETITVLKDVNLRIEAGEMVAIVGASGSGKSTLMNILGCLDRPTRGSYKVAGRETGKLAPDELAELRREHFGFIFQRYHLLSDLNASGNVEVPAVYAGVPSDARHARSTALLTRLGLADRMDHRPSQLSGGQQQRVSIARALMNGGEVILADEPTGALDTHSGEEVMKILKELHAEGHTIIIVTHDMHVAEHAQRIIEISDGAIIADRRRGEPGEPGEPGEEKTAPAQQQAGPRSGVVGASWDRLREAFRMAILSMTAHRLRTFLTMLGIIIGIASVVSVVALGQGSSRQVLDRISSMGTNTIDIRSGQGFGDERAGRVQTLVPTDADALSQQLYVDSVTPVATSSASLRYRNVSATGTINGVGAQFFRVRGYNLARGVAFDDAAVRSQSQDVVIDENTQNTLFGPDVDPIGQVILLGKIPARVIGITETKENAFGNTDALNVWIPYTTVLHRILGQSHLRSITVRVADEVPMDVAEQNLTELLTRRHGTQDFFAINTDSIRQTVQSTTATMTLLVSAIALISLVVGGIGVMNIMLVSVTERTHEIGVRMAVGARQSDIMTQFLIEAVLVCLLGGILGILLALGIGQILDQLGSDGFSMEYSSLSMVAAFVCSTVIGIAFGFLPARNAARLDPINALARD
jgi:macrolide transport system ATP-binding/permease protein